MLSENARAEGMRFFHASARSSSVGVTVDYAMALLVVAGGLDRLMERRMRGYADSPARQIVRDLIEMPADVMSETGAGRVRLPRRAPLPIVLASGISDNPVQIPWWNNAPLRIIESPQPTHSRRIPATVANAARRAVARRDRVGCACKQAAGRRFHVESGPEWKRRPAACFPLPGSRPFAFGEFSSVEIRAS